MALVGEGGQGSPEGQPWLGRRQRDRVPQRGGRHREPPVLPTVHSADTCQIPPSPDGAEPPLPVLELPGVWGPCGPQPPPSARRLTPLSLGFQQTFPVALPPSPAWPPLRQEGLRLFSRHAACTYSVWISHLLPLQGTNFRDGQGVCVNLTPVLSICIFKTCMWWIP